MLRLCSWHKLLQREFQHFKAEKWSKFITNAASPHPTTFWRAVGTLNKKKSTRFPAINNNNNVYISPKEIIDCLPDYVSTHFAPPTVNTNNTVDQEAQMVWDDLHQTNHYTIQEACIQSDLKFSANDVKKVISSLTTKNSVALDKVSNKMVKIMLQNYMDLVADAYNTFFKNAYSGKSWKQARTICFNKADYSASTTSQLRPISLLPIFGKIYERLFLLKFKSWVRNITIVPWQQSGVRSHMG